MTILQSKINIKFELSMKYSYKKMLKINSLLFVVIFCCKSISAQQTQNFNLLRSNLSLLNPANVDMDFYRYNYWNKVSANYKSAWAGFEGAPKTIQLNGEFLFPPTNNRKLGYVIGGNLLSDKAGRLSHTSATFRYSTIITSDIEEGGLSIGTNVSVSQYSLSTKDITADNYSKLANYLDDFKSIIPNLGIGLFYYKIFKGSGYNSSENILYGGISVPNLFSLGNADEQFFTPVQHNYVNIGFINGLRDESFIELSSWTKLQESGVWISDLRITYSHRSKVNMVIGYNSENFVTFGFGVRTFTVGEASRIHINYGGQLPIGTGLFRNYGVSHEIGFAISFGDTSSSYY